MNIIVNGKQRQIVLEEPTLEHLLTVYSLQEKSVIIESNGEIIPKEKIGSTNVKEGDRIEIIQFVGGG